MSAAKTSSPEAARSGNLHTASGSTHGFFARSKGSDTAISNTLILTVLALVAILIFAPAVPIGAAAAAHDTGDVHVENPTVDNVDDDGNTSSAEDTDGDAVYSTIQYAVDNASSGETITVANGTYSEGVDITTDDLTLQGSGRPTIKGTGSDGGERGKSGALPLHIDGANNVTIDGFEVTNREGPRAILVGASGSSGSTPSASVKNATIRNNTIGPVVYDNPKSDAGGESRGIFVRIQGQDIVIKNNTVKGIKNTVDGDANGILLSSFASDPVMKDVVVKENTVKNITTDNGEKAKGVSADGDVDNLTIADNRITDIGPSNKTRGIQLTEDKGANPNRGPRNFSIVRNDIDSLSKTPGKSPAVVIQVGGYDTLGTDHEIRNNNLLGDAVERFSETSSADTLNATSNWWGDASGPGGTGPGDGTRADTFGPGGDFNFTPWLDGPFDAGGQPTAPAKNLDTGEQYPTVQSAVDDAGDGDTVKVTPGTYTESVTIPATLSDFELRGSGNPKLVGTGAGSGSQPHATIHIKDGSSDAAPNATNITVRGFTIRNPNGTYGVFAGSGGSGANVSDLTITNNTIKAVGGALSGPSPLTGSVAGIYVRAGYSNARFSNNTVRNVTDTGNNNAAGISLSSFLSGYFVDGGGNPALNTTVSDNVITDIDTGRVAKGVAASGEFDGLVIKNNSISDLTGGSDSDGGTGGISLTENPNGGDIDNDGSDERIGPQNFTLRQNEVRNVTASGTTGFFAPNSLFIGGYEALGSEHNVTENNFISGAVARYAGNQAGYQIGDGGNVSATKNYFNASTGPSGDGPGTGVPVVTLGRDVSKIDFEPFYTDSERSSLSVAANDTAAEAGETAVVQLSGSSVNNSSVSIPAGSGEIRVSIATAEKPTGPAPSPSQQAATYLDISTNESLSDSTTISVNISMSSLQNAGINSVDATLLHYDDGSWTELDTDVSVSGDSVTLTATVNDLSPFAVAEKSESTDGGDDGSSGGGGGGGLSEEVATGERRITQQFYMGSLNKIGVEYEEPVNGLFTIERQGGLPTRAPTPEGEVVAVAKIEPPSGVADRQAALRFTLDRAEVGRKIDESELVIARVDTEDEELSRLDTRVVDSTDETVTIATTLNEFSTFAVIVPPADSQRTVSTGTATSAGTTTPSTEVPESSQSTDDESETAEPTPSTATPTTHAPQTTTSTSGAGFGVLFAIVAIIGVVLLARRR